MSNVGLRAPNGILVLVVAVIAAATYTAVVLIVTSGASFYHDEWWYICGRALGDPASWFKPHNEHFVLLHVIAYRALVEGFGLGSYLPFQLATIAPHLMVVLAVAALVDRHASRGAAVGAGLVMLFLGAGYLNLFWGFQVGFVGSTALGLWALWFLPARPLAASVVLALSVATQGVGLFFVVAAGGYLFASGRFRSALWLALPLAVYGIWALTMREAVDVRGELDVAAIPAFVLLGLLATVAATAGLPLLPSVGVALSVIASRPRAWRSPIVVGCALGLLAEYVALATVRQGFGSPAASHYVYVGAAFLIPIAATLLGSARHRRVGLLLLVIVFAAGFTGTVRQGMNWVELTSLGRDSGSDQPPAGVCYASPTLDELKALAGYER